MKTKGFTLLELLAGMTATSIVIGTAFTALHISQAIYNRMQSSFQTGADMSMMHAQLSRDILRTDTCVLNEDGGVTLYNTDAEAIRYIPYNGKTIRIFRNLTDTIPVSITYTRGSSSADCLLAQIRVDKHVYRLPLQLNKNEPELSHSINQWRERCLEH
ncbi:MAG: hypothetical protein RL007_541 [Bacteroidota bacterium]|jgi:prepilin-type N-terminal cleavage/methylation domain-containing protein